jgi:hypothetical protein
MHDAFTPEKLGPRERHAIAFGRDVTAASCFVPLLVGMFVCGLDVPVSELAVLERPNAGLGRNRKVPGSGPKRREGRAAMNLGRFVWASLAA